MALCFEFIIRKVSVDAFSMLYSNLLHAKLCASLFLVPLLLHYIGNLFAHTAALFVTSVCRQLTFRGRPEIAGSNPIRSKFLLIRGLFLFFILHFIKLLFCRVLASVCEAQLRSCVRFLQFVILSV